MKNLNLFKVNTTAFSEEDFLLLTTLTEAQIVEVIEPIVLLEREVVSGDVMYTNEDYVYLLQKHYPSETITQYDIDGIQTISI